MPQVAFPATRTIDSLGIAHVQRLEHPMQSINGGRNNHQMNMIGHQAIGEHIDTMLVSILPEPFEGIGNSTALRSSPNEAKRCPMGRKVREVP